MAPQQWRVVGGADRGGILVREGQALASSALKERLATGSILEEADLQGERLQFRLVKGTGPATGWVSLQVSGKHLVVKHREDRPAKAKPATPAPAAAPPQREERPAPVAQRQPTPTAALPVSRKPEPRQLPDTSPPAKAGLLDTYCIKYGLLGFPLGECRLRLLCFHGAGGTERAFTAPNTPFLEWVKASKVVEVLSVDYPGRNKLLSAPKASSVEELGKELFSVLKEKLSDGVPYVVWAHSVGTWVAFEVLQLALQHGLKLPLAALLAAFPAPDLAEGQRPWRRSRDLDDGELRQEVRSWDPVHFDGPGGAMFEIGWEKTWEPLIRGDFRLFDEYNFRHGGAAKFAFPVHAWHMEEESLIKPEMVASWQDWTRGAFEQRALPNMGHLTSLYGREQRGRYFAAAAELLEGCLKGLK